MHRRLLLTVTVVGCLVAAAGAQDKAAAKPPAKPKFEPVLSHIPDGAMGYVVINNIKAATGRIDTFLTDTGIKALLIDDPSLALLDVLQATMMLGEGFDPAGGFGAALLNPKDYGIDLPALMTQKRDPDNPVKLPIVIYLPATGIDALLGLHPMAKDGRFMKVNMHFGTVYATKVGGYVLLSPLRKALAAAVDAKAKARSKLSPARLAAIAKSDFAAHVDMKLASPVFDSLLKKLAGKLIGVGKLAGASGMTLDAESVSSMMGMSRDLLAQVDTIVLTGRFDADGVVLEDFAEFRPGSDMAKAIAKFRPSTGGLLNGLPKMTYIAAIGLTGQPFTDMGRMMTDSLLKTPKLAKLPDDVKDEMRAMLDETAGQITSIQVVIGLAPKDSEAVMALAYVIRCTDSAKFRELVGRSAAMKNKILPAMFGAQGHGGPKITYKANVDKLGDMPLDEFTMAMPAPKGVPAMAATMSKQMWGGDAIRLLIGAPDKKTLVMVTGGKKQMSRAIKAAKAGKDNILVGPDAKLALKHLPANPAMVMVFNGAHAQETQVRQMEKLLGERPPATPLAIKCKVPMLIAAGIDGKTVHGVVYAPKQLVTEITRTLNLVIQMQRMMKGPAQKEQPTPEGGEES